MVSDVTFSTALQQQENTNNTKVSLAEDFDQFLSLLTTQLQNQDPLSPMDSTEFTNQIVMFSGVEQQINMNQKLDSLVSLALGNNLTNSLQYVGLDISYLSSEMYFDGQTPAKISYALDDQAVEAKMNVRDENGESVYSVDIPRRPGQHEVVWDGTLDAGGFAGEGTYTVTIDALNADDKSIGSTTVVSGRVKGIETQNGSLYALVGDRAVPLNRILNAREPDYVAPPETSTEGTEETEES